MKSLQSEPRLDGERKTITKGSMELLEDLDPEGARNIIDRALQLMMNAVRHYGGFIAQSVADTYDGSEGVDTVDLKEAKARLDELR